ncbi:S-layer homology domain-containing protein [Paenibacillus sp. sgz302251]|uniref:S-layer homology domain-containing protein n=1 Tax=Paenibacillus sp. sgz302251 TaxID=3414493 RepID=UPI003C7DA80C
MYAIEVPAEFLTKYGEKFQIKLSTELGSMLLRGNMLANNEAAGEQEKISIMMAKSEVPQNAAIQGKVGVVIDLHVESEGQALAYNNKDAAVTVQIPYALSEEELENVELLSVWYVDEQGHVQLVPTGKYDFTSKEMRFQTSHFSKYAISYLTKSFNDLSPVPWAPQAIQVLASKGIINGVTDRSYQPGSFITRADFTKILIEALGITAAVNTSFVDVNQDDYYYEAVGIAHSLGIIEGSGDRKFKALISGYAADAVAALVKMGLVRREVMAESNLCSLQRVLRLQ